MYKGLARTGTGESVFTPEASLLDASQETLGSALVVVGLWGWCWVEMGGSRTRC